VLRQIGEKNIRLGIKIWSMKKKYRYHCKIGTKGNDGNGKKIQALATEKTCNMGENHATLARLGLVSYRKNMYYVGYILYNIPYTDENKRFKRANLKNKRILKARAKSYKIRGLR
jgi:hypothetical protein